MTPHLGLKRRLAQLFVHLERVSDARVFAATFAWVIGGGLLLQLVLLPYLGPSFARDGLVRHTDAGTFHQIALYQASLIRTEGWSAWVPRPFDQAPAGLASAVYVLIYPAPWAMLPVNGVLFGAAVVASRRTLASLLGSRGVALAAVSPFFLFPSFVMAWGQLHKDVITGAGWALVLSALELARSGGGGARWFRNLSPLALIGVLLLWLGRPYLLAVTLLSTLAFLMIALLVPRSNRLRMVAIAALLTAGSIAEMGHKDSDPRPAFRRATGEAPAEERRERPKMEPPERRMRCDPRPGDDAGRVDRLLYELCRQREVFRVGYRGAGSMFDTERPLRTATAVIGYAPRALAAGLLFPGPPQWFRRAQSEVGQLGALLVPFEMTFAYVVLAWAAALVAARRAPGALWPLLAFCVTFIVIHVYGVPNIGALYRMRMFALTTIVCALLGVVLRATTQPGSETTRSARPTRNQEN